MKIPNASHAEIAPSKLRDYLLDLEHQHGGSKATLLYAYGYTAEEWQRLEQDLRRDHLEAEVDAERTTDYGRRFEVVAPLATPDGRELLMRSIWQIDTGKDHPRLITMYPE